MRRVKIVLWAFCLCVLLGGCAFSAGAEELYRLPKLPNEYASLEARINALQLGGAEHVAPQSGSNLQSVQLVDLDGDGAEEAIAFFRNTADEKPLKVYIFKAVEEQYEQLAVIEGSAASIWSVAYSDLDGDGAREILIGYRTLSEVQMLAVYALRGGQPQLLLSSTYLRYAARDLDGDGAQEPVLLRSGEEGLCSAVLFHWDEESGVFAECGSVSLSVGVSELQRVSGGTLLGGASALFITGVTDGGTMLTDILTLREGALCAVARSASTGRTEAVSRFLELYPADADDDGVTEIPITVDYPSPGEGTEGLCAVEWRRYDADGAGSCAWRSVQQRGDGWELRIPDAWDGRVGVERAENGSESRVIFSVWQREGAVPFLTVSTLTGESREYAAARGARFVLARQVDAVYTAELIDETLAASMGVSEQSLRESFSLIAQEWTTGEN